MSGQSLLRAVGIGAVISAFAIAVFAQTPASPAFEVASVKISAPCVRCPTSISPYGQGIFTVRNATLQLLINLAFDVSDIYITGGPSWRASEYYDITAKPEAGVMLTYDEMKPRLQQLLQQRFRLTVHREMKDFQGYALVVAKGGSKLKEAAPGTAGAGAIAPGVLLNHSASMQYLAFMLSRPTVAGGPVVDKTGTTGTYDVVVKFAPEGAADSPLPSIFTAVEEELGLKLEAQKVPVEILVVDRAAHPTDD